jgi:hypothetical protein
MIKNPLKEKSRATFSTNHLKKKPYFTSKVQRLNFNFLITRLVLPFAMNTCRLYMLKKEKLNFKISTEKKELTFNHRSKNI